MITTPRTFSFSQQPLFAQMFGDRQRNTGAGVGYQLASAIAGGFTPFIATWLVAAAGGHWWPVALYLLLGCLVTTLVAWRISPPAQAPGPAPGPDPAPDPR